MPRYDRRSQWTLPVLFLLLAKLWKVCKSIVPEPEVGLIVNSPTEAPGPIGDDTQPKTAAQDPLSELANRIMANLGPNPTTLETVEIVETETVAAGAPETVVAGQGQETTVAGVEVPAGRDN